MCAADHRARKTEITKAKITKAKITKAKIHGEHSAHQQNSRQPDHGARQSAEQDVTHVVARDGMTGTVVLDQPRRFLLTQVYVKTADGWKLSTLLPFPTP